MPLAQAGAAANRTGVRAKDNNINALVGLSDSSISALAAIWDRTELESGKILEKYQPGLSVSEKQVFDKGALPYQDIDNLIKLRNALVHYRPEWDDEAKAHRKLQSRLRSKFPLNPFVQESSLWFPHQCLGAGCAQWAVNASKELMFEFCSRMGIRNRF